MPKLSSQGSVKKIDITLIKETGNVRSEYTDIGELAESIRVYGQLQPVLVNSAGKNADGIEEYEMVAGHRRMRALRYLCDNGQDFSQVNAVVVSGDKLTLQLVENLQRADLTSREREKGIYEMTKDGKIPSREIALMLGKNEQFVWRNINAYKIRALTEERGIDTKDISTTTLCEIATVAEGDIPLLIERIKEAGGTTAAARRVNREYQKSIEEPSLPMEDEPEETPDEKHEEPSESDAGDGGEYQDFEKNLDAGEDEYDGSEDDEYDDYDDTDEDDDGGDEDEENDGDEHEKTPKEKSPKSLLSNPKQKESDFKFEAAHKQVDLNDVFVTIKQDYIETLNGTISDPQRSQRAAAGWDIIALLHKRFA